MTVSEFEKAVWTLEGIRIVIRAPADSQVEEYGFANAADKNLSITRLIANRIQQRVGNSEVVVIGGDGALAHGLFHLDTLRASYHQGQG